MRISNLPFCVTTRADVPGAAHPGTSGVATRRTRQFGLGRGTVDHSAGYVADHWCQKGHLLLVVAGELTSALTDGRRFVFAPSMSYRVAAGAAAPLSRPAPGAIIFLVY